MVALGSFRLAPYQKVTVGISWEPAPPATYADDLIQRRGFRKGEGVQPGATEDAVVLADAKATYATINIVMNMKGDSEVLSMDAAKGAYKPASLLRSVPHFQAQPDRQRITPTTTPRRSRKPAAGCLDGRDGALNGQV